MKKYLILLLFLVYAGMAGAQSLVIMTRDGSEQTKNLAAVQNLTFSAGNLVVKNRDGSTSNQALSDIRKIYFKPGSTGNDYIISGRKELISFFPNPVENYLHLENLPEGISVAHIFRIDGSRILQREVSGGDCTIDASRLARGIYLLTVQGQTIKFVKL